MIDKIIDYIVMGIAWCAVKIMGNTDFISSQMLLGEDHDDYWNE